MAATDGAARQLDLFLLAAAFALSVVGCNGPPSYTIEKTITLPDSLSGLSYDAIAYSRRDNRVIVGLWDGRVLVIDAASGEKLAIVPSNGPGALVYDPTTDEVYLPPVEPGAHSDPHRDSVLSTLAEVRLCSPAEICVDPVTERIYCYLHTWSDSITVLDSRTLGVVASVATEHHDPWGTNAVCCSPKMHRVYWVQADGHSPLTVVDAGTNQTIASVEVGQNATPLCYNPVANKVYVSSGFSVLVVDCRSNRVVASIPVMGLNNRMCCNVRENKVYGIERDSVVVAIDGASDRIIGRTNVPGEAYDLVYDSTRDRIYCCGQDWVAAIDSRTDKVVRLVRTSTLSHEPRGVFCPQADKLYILQWDPYEVYAIDCAEFTVASRTTVGYYVGALLYNSGQDKVYCANSDGDAVAVVDAATEAVRSIVQVRRFPWALCCNGDGTRVYSANMGGSVSVIDALADTVITSIEVRGAPTALCYCAPYDRVYCAGEEPRQPAPESSTNHGLAVIECRTNSVVKELDVPVDIGSRLVYDALRDRVYVSVGSGVDARVTVVDVRGDSVIAARAVGSWPATRWETAARLGKWATGAVAYAPRHRRTFAGSQQGRVVVLRGDVVHEDEIRLTLRRLGEEVRNMLAWLPHGAKTWRPTD
jgi:YVTN family beta-propeller protein